MFVEVKNYYLVSRVFIEWRRREIFCEQFKARKHKKHLQSTEKFAGELLGRTVNAWEPNIRQPSAMHRRHRRKLCLQNDAVHKSIIIMFAIICSRTDTREFNIFISVILISHEKWINGFRLIILGCRSSLRKERDQQPAAHVWPLVTTTSHCRRRRHHHTIHSICSILLLNAIRSQTTMKWNNK